MATTYPLHALHVSGAYGIDLRPHRQRRSASIPLAVLALVALGIHWFLAPQRRRLTYRVALAALLVVISTPFALRPSFSLLPLPRLLPAASTSASLDTWPATFRTPYLPSVTLPSRPARPEPAAAIAPAQPGAAPEPPTAPPSRTPWEPSNVAAFPYPNHIETWRPLVRQLLAEAWDEGRLDGPAARIDDDLVLALIRQESQGDPDAESWVGAIGLMQVMPFTFADVMAGDRSLTCAIDPAAMWDVPSNMRAGLRYLALAMNSHEGNLYWALASYNAGIEAVDDWRAADLYAVPPAGGYWETADYAQRILRDYLSRRPDIAPLIHVPDPMPQSHLPGALRLLQDLDTTRGGPRPKEWIPRCR